MMHRLLHNACVGFAFLLLVCAGCAIPGGYVATNDVCMRTNESNQVSEKIIERESASGRDYPLTPEGPQRDMSSHNLRYYFVGGSGKPKELPFLRRDFGKYITSWSIFKPVEQTNCWIRVEGPYLPPGATSGGTVTQRLVITVFTPDKLLHQRDFETADFPRSKHLQFTDGNRTIAYTSENDHFIFSVLADELNKTDSPK